MPSSSYERTLRPGGPAGPHSGHPHRAEGTHQFRFGVDTGATRTAVAGHVLHALGYAEPPATERRLARTGAVATRAGLVRVTRLQALGQVRTDFPVLWLPLDPGVMVEGLQGLDFFRGLVLTVDFARGPHRPRAGQAPRRLRTKHLRPERAALAPADRGRLARRVRVVGARRQRHPGHARQQLQEAQGRTPPATRRGVLGAARRPRRPRDAGADARGGRRRLRPHPEDQRQRRGARPLELLLLAGAGRRRGEGRLRPRRQRPHRRQARPQPGNSRRRDRDRVRVPRGAARPGAARPARPPVRALPVGAVPSARPSRERGPVPHRRQFRRGIRLPSRAAPLPSTPSVHK